MPREYYAWLWMPFHFWTVVFFILGSIVGSLLNVLIHRMPRGESVITPGSHCPHCQAAIPWYLNLPILTWIFLRGKCANCGASISVRYLIVETLTGSAFMASWVVYGGWTPWLPLAYSILMAGLIAASFIDGEHYIIPHEITLGGMLAGLLLSALVPSLHDTTSRLTSLGLSALGLVVGGGLIYSVVRMGKILFGRYILILKPGSKVVFTDHSMVLAEPDIQVQTMFWMFPLPFTKRMFSLPSPEVPFDELFYRENDTVSFQAETVDLGDRQFANVPVRLSLIPSRLVIGEESLDPGPIVRMEVITSEIIAPREAMGFGDVTFMAAIGSFLGWQAIAPFILLVSALLAIVAGFGSRLFRGASWSSRLPYGPYIAMAATIWIFGGKRFYDLWVSALF